MIDSRDEMFLWVEKYRPQKIDDCVLPQALKDTFRQYVEQGELPNFLFTGSAGVGKTTIAKALCNEIGAEFMMINGSEESGIDTLRTKIKGFASTISLTDAKKVVILDEADYLNANSTQPALRGFIEEFANNCRFILTCNFKNRIIEPIHSRCSVVEFKIDSKDKQEIAATFFKRAVSILKQEQIEFDPKVVAELITKHFPDYRRILNELQRYSVSGKIDSGILVNMSEESFKSLIKLLKEKDFTEVRKWVSKNSDSDTTSLFRELYDSAATTIEPNSVPQLVLILADYQYKAAFVADHELNIMAALTETMAQCKFK
ncbi:HolB ATPase involved in DNA replication [uncultured Caudovirales phage]|uniref:Sliding-clamp-loader large subunit n=1 Tax=uncultured Caudovirales phage TaxID=2100421 RepID=A0A6J5RZI8_9CAUD|nr:HolB ATPase involved in DNA replication [uncultured Caudovirales phage]CAB4181947.1 HolB ATPase involved in DNA replication [uncultured Caudovirales phage]CAB4197724.1 HolB ATPase involved in DNA replication [uncultured Caudovirales phage]CAB4211603.1 HolB ATPase involved in DNA replication [uncultured Caudovirales phage]CAB5238716.1 HolB ATPase involved in DNA replication [uncultured Caudovirales phage]